MRVSKLFKLRSPGGIAFFLGLSGLSLVLTDSATAQNSSEQVLKTWREQMRQTPTPQGGVLHVRLSEYPMGAGAMRRGS